MDKIMQLSDDGHPEIQKTAQKLTMDKLTPIEKVESLFLFVRDAIPFGFPPVWDAVKASETLQHQVGYCTTKATLFHALCQAVGIPSRIHAGLIKTEIMRGILPAYAFPFLPDTGSHVWMEIKLNEHWQPIDSYINDHSFYVQALQRLKNSSWENGFSISLAQGPSSDAFNFGEIGFVQMGAVVEDQGSWEDYAEFMATDQYKGLTAFQSATYSWVLRRAANKNINRIRMG
jgi:hypothetical protein